MYTDNKIFARIRALLIPLLLSILAANALGQNYGRTVVSLDYDTASPQVTFAADEIRQTLDRLGFAIDEDGGGTRIVLTVDSRFLRPQHYRIRYERPDLLRITGGDAVGTMYGGLEIEEMLRLGTPLSATPQREGKPFILRRGIKFNIPLDARAPSFDDTGDAAQKNIATMWDFDFWREYLDDLARHRFNLLTLWTTHPYPTLVKLENYPDVAYDDVSVFDQPIDYSTHSHWNNIDLTNPANRRVIKRITIDEKIVFWQRVMQHAEDRGIDVYLFHWNIHTHGATGKYGIDHQQDNPKTVAYLRESVKQLLLTYPNIKGIGVTAGERVDTDLEGEYSIENWLWKTYGLGIMDAKAVEPDREVRFIFRKHWSVLADIRNAFAEYTDPFETSFKYARARVYTTTNPPFFDQFYRDEVAQNQIKCWLNLRNDDIFVHRWGNPDHVRQFLVNLPHDLMAGFYMR